jgi:hypothetical protein
MNGSGAGGRIAGDEVQSGRWAGGPFGPLASTTGGGRGCESRQIPLIRTVVERFTCSVPLSHHQVQCEVLFGARRRARARRRKICSPARCSARVGVGEGAEARGLQSSVVAMCSSARGPAALSTSGGLGCYWAAQWHLARAVGKRFRGCRTKRLYVHHLMKH